MTATLASVAAPAEEELGLAATLEKSELTRVVGFYLPLDRGNQQGSVTCLYTRGLVTTGLRPDSRQGRDTARAGWNGLEVQAW
jgi:hypothetical protein